MPSLNFCILMGHLTRNPELRYTPHGSPIASFGLAVNRRYKQGEDTKEEVCFVDCVAFGKMAEFAAQYFTKGMGACVEGRLQYRTWETEDQHKRSKHEIVVDRLQFTEKKQD